MEIFIYSPFLFSCLEVKKLLRSGYSKGYANYLAGAFSFSAVEYTLPDANVAIFTHLINTHMN